MNRLPPNQRIFFGIPCSTRNIDVDCIVAVTRKIDEIGGRFQACLGISDIALARNKLAHKFKQSDCDWFQMVDSDIIFSPQDWDYLWDGTEDVVTAPYGKKIPGHPPAEYGLGFTRVHRRVFEALDSLEKDNGSEYVSRFYLDGEILSHYFISGVTGDSRWLGEDRGFFSLCALAQVSHRLERRCQLQHVGSFLYGYPNQDNGVKFWYPNEARCEMCGEPNGKHIPQCPANGALGDSRPIVVM